MSFSSLKLRRVSMRASLLRRVQLTPWTVACQAPRSMGILQARILEWVAMPSSRGSSQGIEPKSPTLQAESLPSEPTGESLVSFQI